MATSTETRSGFGSSIVSTIVLSSGLATLGSILVVMGLTDFLAYLDGYRPGGPVVQLYASSIIVLTTGWTLLIAAAVATGRAIRGDSTGAA